VRLAKEWKDVHTKEVRPDPLFAQKLKVKAHRKEESCNRATGDEEVNEERVEGKSERKHTRDTVTCKFTSSGVGVQKPPFGTGKQRTKPRKNITVRVYQKN